MTITPEDEKKAIIIDDKLTNPTGDYVKDYLLSQTKESSFLDFKWTINVQKNSDFPKIVKDIFAFSNYGGGFIVIGVKQNDHKDDTIKGSFVKTGLPENLEIDQATLQEKINSYFEKPITTDFMQFYRKTDQDEKKFALLYIQPSTDILKPIKDGIYTESGKEKRAFYKDKVYTRRGTASVIASDYEISRIKKRIGDENYRISILSGEPDKIEEKLFSNLFEIKIIPKFVYIGESKFQSYQEVYEWLQTLYPNSNYFLKYRPYENEIVTFQNLEDPSNIHRGLVHSDQIHKEPTKLWLDGGDKENIITSLLLKELAGYAEEKQGMTYFEKNKKLFYQINEGDSCSISWPSRYKGVTSRIVATKLWASQLGRYVFWHAAIKPAIYKINEEFYLKLSLTSIITENGRKVTTGMGEGTVITRRSYYTYNNQYLNNILFWINVLGQGNELVILPDYIISNEPIQTTIDTGILWDIPTFQIKNFIEKYQPEEYEEEEYEDNNLDDLDQEENEEPNAY